MCRYFETNSILFYIQLMCKLSVYAPSLVAGMVEQLIVPLSKTLSKKPANKEPAPASSSSSSNAAAAANNAASGPELERAMDLVKSCVRAVLAINLAAMEDSNSSGSSGGGQQGVVSRKWVEFVDKVKKDDFTAEIVRALETEKSFDAY